MNRTPSRLMIVGPTASGKSDLAFRLALELNAEIISVDSRQCYRKIDIGTAKPDRKMLERIPHYNISILDPDERDTVAAFLVRCKKWSEQIRSKGKRVIYAGGSTLHLESLIRPLDELPPADPENLERLKKRADSEGLEALYREFARIDPDSADRMDGLNRHRIFRALDVWMQTGKPLSSFHTADGKSFEPPDDLHVFGLRRPRADLHRRIGERVDRMIDQGLVEETRRLLMEGYDPEAQFLQTVGYRSAIDHLSGKMNRLQMAEEIKTATRRYARRQLTWFRRWPFVRWIDASSSSTGEIVARIIETVSKDESGAAGEAGRVSS